MAQETQLGPGKPGWSNRGAVRGSAVAPAAAELVTAAPDAPKPAGAPAPKAEKRAMVRQKPKPSKKR